MKDIFTIKEFKKKNRKKNHLIFICDHASNLIPSNYKNLGLKENHLRSHIAYDLGAKKFCEILSGTLEQTSFYANFSRLLIDPNRSELSNDLILSESAGIQIPGNLDVANSEKKKRLDLFYRVYHSGLRDLIKKKKKEFDKIYLISIHSFTQKFIKKKRGLEIGLLWNKNMNLLIPIQKSLIDFKIHFGRNFPYSGFHYNYTLDRHSQFGRIDNICLEFRNDLICNEKRINKYINVFEKILKGFLK